MSKRLILNLVLFATSFGVGLNLMALRDWLHPIQHIQHLAGRDIQEIVGDDAPMIIRPGEYAQPVPSSPQKDDPRLRDPDTKIYGATGTPIVSGFVTELGEYNPELRGRGALGIYEKMRRSDADVAAVLAACKLPIRAAEYKVIPGAKENEKDYQLAKELAQFVEDNLFGGLEYDNSLGMTFSQRFESVIDNDLLCLDFGCSGSEDIWRIDGDKVRLQRIAPRLPMTFYRFHTEPDGETLKSVEQWGYRGNQFVNVAVPADKFTLFSFMQEGANFYGRSILRAAYQHWYVKNALYRIDSIACERNGAGVPVITMGPNADQEDKTSALGWVTNLAAHQSTGLVLPNAWQFDLKGVTGREHAVLPSIQHHSEMICRSALAMFMTLGTTQSGSRALGGTMQDFFLLSEEATGKYICDTRTETTIRRLVDINFYKGDNKPLPYPRLVIPNIAAFNPLELFTALKDLASSTVDLIQPDDETENWIRKKVGLPLKSKEMRIRYAPVQQKVQETPPVGETPEEIESNNTGAQPTVKDVSSGKRIPKQQQPQQDPLDKGTQSKANQKPGIPQPKTQPAIAKPKSVAASEDEIVGLQLDEKRVLLNRPLHQRLKWHGLDISIENAKGSVRKGNGWSQVMSVPYGYIRKSEAADGDHVDVFVGNNLDADYVYIIHQHNPETGIYDEDKCMIGFLSADSAKAAFMDNHSDGQRWYKSMSVIPVEEFIQKVKSSFYNPGKIHAMDYPHNFSIGLTEPTRALKPHEKKHNFGGHIARQDSTTTAIRRILGGARPILYKEAARRAAQYDPQHLDSLTLPFDKGLMAKVAKSVKIAHNYGHAQVYAERYRATGRPRKEKPAITLSVESASQDKPSLIAEAAISDLNNSITAKARGSQIDNYKQGLRDADLEEAILGDLEDSSDGFLDRIAMEAGRSGVVGGRYGAFQELADEIGSYARSEAMDQNTCGPCEEGDGDEWESLDDVDWSPGDDCEGADACRGQLMPIFDDEGMTELE